MKIKSLLLKSYFFGIFVIYVSLNACNSQPYILGYANQAQDSTYYGSPKEIQSMDSTENEYQECSLKKMEWTAGEKEPILLDPQVEYMFPGNVLDARSLHNGKYKNITGDRTPITLIISSTAFNKPIWKVENPSASTIKQAIDTMLRSGTTGNVEADGVVKEEEIYSEKHLEILLKSNFSGGFGSVSAGFNFKDKNVLSRYLLDLTQVYYTIFVEPPSDHQFFKSKPIDLNDSSVAPVYVSSVKYGRRVLISVESKVADQKKDANLRAKMNAIASSGSLDFNLFASDFFEGRDVKVLVKGGDSKNIYKIFKAVSNRKELYDAIEDDAHWSMHHLGVPLAFQVKNVTNDENFWVSQAGIYDARICKIKDQYDTTVSIPVQGPKCLWQTGGTDRNFGTHPEVSAQVKIFPDPTSKNIIKAGVQVRMIEPGGDRTSGAYLDEWKIVTLPEDYEIIEITSPKEFISPNSAMKSQREEKPGNESNSPIQSMVLIGDSPGSSNNNDDLYPGTCSPNHAQIESATFYPVTFRFSRKVKKN